MKNLDYKWFIIGFLGIVLIIGTILVLRTRESESLKFQKKEAILLDSLQKSYDRVGVLTYDQKQLEKELSITYQEINNQKIIISKLKKRLNEKADSVYNLNDTQSLEFLSEWLSKRGNTK